MNSVQRTLYIPLYGKAMVSRKGILLADEMAERLWAQNTVPLGRKSKSRWLAYFMAMRARVFDDWVARKLRELPEAVVLHIGCGLDSRVARLDEYRRAWYDVDFPEVIAERKKHYTERGGYRMLSGDAENPAWLSALPHGGAAIVVMEGISMYLRPQALQGLFAALSVRFDSVHLLMDVYTTFGARMTKARNPVREVGVSETYGIDDPTAPAHKSALRCIERLSMTPPELVTALPGIERHIFRRVYAGRLAEKLYRLYAYQK